MGQPSEDRDARVTEEAAQWLEKLERTISADESAALRRWLQPALHRRVIVERCKLWHGPEILAVLGELIPVETFAQRVERHYGRMVLAIFLGVSGISFATVLIAVGKILPGTDARQNPLRAELSLQTQVGERKTIHMPDGGSLVLNSATRVLLSYGPRSRDATLLRGEATFDAKDDPARPFVVFARGRRFQVEPGGAKFNVQLVAADKIDLTVLEGRVRAPRGRSKEPLSPALLRARVDTGEHTYSAGEGGLLGQGWQTPMTLPPQDIDARLAWQRG